MFIVKFSEKLSLTMFFIWNVFPEIEIFTRWLDRTPSNVGEQTAVVVPELESPDVPQRR